MLARQIRELVESESTAEVGVHGPLLCAVGPANFGNGHVPGQSGDHVFLLF